MATITESSPLIIKNNYDECFIIIHIKENKQIVAGPIINEKIHEGVINNIIRLNKLPIKIKNKLMNYFENLLFLIQQVLLLRKTLGILFSSNA